MPGQFIVPPLINAIAAGGSRAVGPLVKLYKRQKGSELTKDRGGFMEESRRADPTYQQTINQIKQRQLQQKAKQKAARDEKIRIEKEIEKTFFTPRVSKKKKNMKAGGPVKKCKRDGIAIRGKTKGRMV